MRLFRLSLLVVLAACVRHEAEREAVLRSELASMRSAIQRYRANEGRYPRSLEALVPKYLRTIPADPITKSAGTWRVETEESIVPSDDFTKVTTPKSDVVIVNVRSGAPGQDSAGLSFSEY